MFSQESMDNFVKSASEKADLFMEADNTECPYPITSIIGTTYAGAGALSNLLTKKEKLPLEYARNINEVVLCEEKLKPESNYSGVMYTNYSEKEILQKLYKEGQMSYSNSRNTSSQEAFQELEEEEYKSNTETDVMEINNFKSISKKEVCFEKDVKLESEEFCDAKIMFSDCKLQQFMHEWVNSRLQIQTQWQAFSEHLLGQMHLNNKKHSQLKVEP